MKTSFFFIGSRFNRCTCFHFHLSYATKSMKPYILAPKILVRYTLGLFITFIITSWSFQRMLSILPVGTIWHSFWQLQLFWNLYSKKLWICVLRCKSPELCCLLCDDIVTVQLLLNNSEAHSGPAGPLKL